MKERVATRLCGHVKRCVVARQTLQTATKHYRYHVITKWWWGGFTQQGFSFASSSGEEFFALILSTCDVTPTGTTCTHAVVQTRAYRPLQTPPANLAKSLKTWMPNGPNEPAHTYGTHSFSQNTKGRSLKNTGGNVDAFIVDINNQLKRLDFSIGDAKITDEIKSDLPLMNVQNTFWSV